MRMRAFTFCCLAFLFWGCAVDRPSGSAGHPTSHAPVITVISGKQSDYSIVLPARSVSPAEMQILKKAALLLQLTFRESTGVELPVVAEKRCCDRKKCSNIVKGIYLGNCLATAQAGIVPEKFAPGEYLITGCNGAVFITGGSVAATLRGVKSFMKEIIGIRFLYPGITGLAIPSRSVISLKKAPAIRQTTHGDGRDSSGIFSGTFPSQPSLLFKGMSASYGLEGPLLYIRTRKQEKTFLPALWTFCRHAFGRAALPMFRFYKAFYEEKSPVARQSWPGSFSTPDRLNKMASFLRAAEKEKTNAKVKRRLMLVRREFDCLYHLTALLRHQNSYRFSPDRSGFEKIADSVVSARRSLALCFDTKGKNSKVPDWPEMTFWNGTSLKKLTSSVSVPLSWDISGWRKSRTLPGLSRKNFPVAPLQKGSLKDPDKGAWQKLPYGELSGNRGKFIRRQTRFKAAYDKKNLYLIFKAELPRERKYKPQGRDKNAAAADHLELFISPAGSKSTWQLLWNPVANSFQDGIKGRITDPLSARFDTFDKSWNGSWKVTNHRKENIWISRVSIPWAALNSASPVPGTRWQINIGRRDFPGKKFSAERSLWVPDWDTHRGNMPEFYGEFIFKRK